MGPRAGRAAGRMLALGVVVLMAGTACGVSPQTRPTKVGEGIVAEPGHDGVGEPPAGPETATGARNLVELYFRAAGGGGDAAEKRVRSFLTGPIVDEWAPGSLKVVRILSDFVSVQINGSIHSIKVRYQVVGELTDKGYLVPGPEPAIDFIFQVQEQGESPKQWRLTTAPPALLLSDAALERSYRTQAIYFWGRSGDRLVPDLRYMSLTVPLDDRPSQVVAWLLDGPSPWLRPVVRSLAEGIEQPRRVMRTEGNGLVVNLSAKAAANPTDLQKLADQLRWSLLRESEGPLELQIEGQKQNIDGRSVQYLRWNAAAAMPEPTKYAISGGRVVVPTAIAQQPSASTPIPLLADAPTYNVGVRTAAISADGRRVAVLRNVAGRVRLSVLRRDTDGKPVVRERDLGRLGTVGRPVWVPGSDRLLVVVNERLRAYNGEAQAVGVEMPSDLRDVTAVAVAPEGRRIALIADDRAYVGTLSVEGQIVTVAGRARIGLDIDRAFAVAWVSEVRVLIAGDSNDRQAMHLTTADGAITDTTLKVGAQQRITDMVAYPAKATSSLTGELNVLVTADSRIHQYFGAESLTALDPANSTAPFYAN